MKSTLLYGCFLPLIGVVVASTAYYFYLQSCHAPGRYPAGLGILAGCCLVFGCFQILSLFVIIRTLLLLKGARRTMPPADGESVMLSGSLQGSEPLPQSALLRRPCVIFQYEVRHQRHGGGSQFTADAHGRMLHECYLNTLFGRVRLKGFPKLEGFQKVDIRALEERCAAFDHLRSLRSPHDQEEPSRQSLESELSDLFEAQTALHREVIESDELATLLRQGWEAAQGDFESYALVESVVLPSENVCAVGRYSQADSSLVPHSGAMMQQLILMRGELGVHRRRYFRMALAACFGIVFFFSIAAAPALWFCGNRFTSLFNFLSSP